MGEDSEERLSRAAGLWLDDVRRALSRRIGMLLRLLVTPKAGAHGGKNLFGEGMFLSGAETGGQGGGQPFRRHRLVDRGIDGPAAFARILDKAGIIVERVVPGERGRGQIEQP